MAYTTIDKPTDYFNTVLWTGNGTDDRSITGVGFKPDWVWYKERSNVGDHTVHDVVRGAGKRLFPADTSAESLDANSLQAFETDGFQIGTNTDVNGSSETYVAWNWLAGGTASSNTDGSITSSVSANTTAGFSIVKIDSMPASTTSTFGHGLGVKPDFIIFKSRNLTTNWDVYHSSALPDGERKLYLNDTDAVIDSGFMNDTAPTSSLISFNPGSSDSNHIAYCFAEKKGYSKFGSYTGNGNADGTFVYTGFLPAFVMFKKTSAADNWLIVDNKRDGYNGSVKGLIPDSSGTEVSSGSQTDLVSNGFKTRANSGYHNGSGQTYIYMAFAEAPFVSSGGIPTTAR